MDRDGPISSADGDGDGGCRYATTTDADAAYRTDAAGVCLRFCTPPEMPTSPIEDSAIDVLQSFRNDANFNAMGMVWGEHK